MTDIRLTARILTVLVSIAALTTLIIVGSFFTAVRLGGRFARALFVPMIVGQVVGALVVLGACAYLVRHEFLTDRTIVQKQFDTVPASSSDHAEIITLVNQFAFQLGVRAPEIAIAETRIPHASISGFTRRGATLVISTGVISSLVTEELAAVIAHELAHLANRDATVVSAGAVPTVIGQAMIDYGMRPSTNKNKNEIGYHLLHIAGVIIGSLVLFIGRSLVAALARYRELAADRTAIRLTGSPAALTGALTTLDETTTEAPIEDLRTAKRVAAFSIISPPEQDTEYTIWPSRQPFLWRFWISLVRACDPLFSTHPPLERRIEQARSLQRDR